MRNSDSPWKRGAIFLTTVAIWWLSDRYLRPQFGALIQSARDLFGDNPFVRHLFSQSLPVVIVCLILFLLYRWMEIIPRPDVSGRPLLILKEGILWGWLICVPTIPLALQLGFHLGFQPNWQLMLGNLFSNSYEEFVFRVFLLLVAAYAFRSVWIAVIISAILFAANHVQYPLSMQILVGVAGVCFTLAYLRSGSILAALLAHQISDMILDSILIQ